MEVLSDIHKGFHYVSLDSLSELKQFTLHQQKKFLQHNSLVAKRLKANALQRIADGKSAQAWYGSQVASLETLENHQEFTHLHLLEATELKIRAYLDAFLNRLSENEFQQKRLDYNDRLGVFSFDRAAIGLHKIKNQQGEEKVVTTVKKSFAYFKKQCITTKSVSIYIIAGGISKVKPEEMLYVGVGVAVLTDFLQKSGIGVAIKLLLGSHSNINAYTITNIKKVEEPLDKNTLLLMTSDPKYFRYQGFKSIIAVHDFFRNKIKNTLGGLDKEAIVQFIKSQQNNDTTASYLFGMSYSMGEAIAEVKRIANDIKEK